MIGRLTGMDGSNDQDLRVHYDDKNRVDYNVSKVQDQTVKTTYQYGDPSNVSQKPELIYGVKINDQDTVSYSYDELARMQERTLNLTSPFKTSFYYLPGSSPGTTTTMVERIQNGNDILSYSYDDLGNIQSISENGELKVTYYYDELNQLVREDNLYQNQSVAYEYDSGGNILRRLYYDYCTGDLETEGQYQSSYFYSYSDTWKDQLIRFNTHEGTGGHIQYDSIGNMISKENDGH